MTLKFEEWAEHRVNAYSSLIFSSGDTRLHTISFPCDARDMFKGCRIIDDFDTDPVNDD